MAVWGGQVTHAQSVEVDEEAAVFLADERPCA